MKYINSKFIINVIFVIFYFISCNSQHKACSHFNNGYLQSDSELEFDLQIKSKQLKFKYTCFQNNQLYFILSDSLERNYSIINSVTKIEKNFNLKSILKDTSMLAEDPITEIVIYNIDTVILLSTFNIICLDKNNKAYLTKPINRTKSGTWPPLNIYISYNGERINADKNDTCIYLGSISGKVDNMNKQYFKHNALVKFNILTGYINEVPIKYPSMCLNKNYGDLSGFAVTSNTSSIVCSYQNVPQLLSFDKQKASVVEINLGKAILDTVKVNATFPWNKKVPIIKRIEAINLNTIYDQIVYSSKYNKYFMVARLAQNKLDKDGNYNTKMDKQVVLFVIDAGFKVINEFYFEMDNFPYANNFYFDEKNFYIENAKSTNSNKGIFIYNGYALDKLCK